MNRGRARAGVHHRRMGGWCGEGGREGVRDRIFYVLRREVRAAARSIASVSDILQVYKGTVSELNFQPLPCP